MPVSVFEARGREGLAEGAFLTLAPNGINALRAIGLADRISALGIPTLGFEIIERPGQAPGAARRDAQPMLAAGALSVTLSRADLLDSAVPRSRSARRRDLLRPCAVRAGAAAGRHRACTSPMARRCTARWVAGCDGVWSRTRRLAFPELARARLHRPYRNRRLRRPAVDAGDRRLHAHGVRRHGVLRLYQGKATGRCSGSIPSRSTRSRRWPSPTRTSLRRWRAACTPAIPSRSGASRSRRFHPARLSGVRHAAFAALARWPRRAARRRRPCGLAACRPGRLDGDRGCGGAGRLPSGCSASCGQAFAAYQRLRQRARRTHRPGQPAHRLAEAGIRAASRCSCAT